MKTTHAIYSSTSGLYVNNVDILSVGNDWYRCIITTTPDLSGDYQFRIFVRNDSVDPFAALLVTELAASTSGARNLNNATVSQPTHPQPAPQ